MRTGSERQGHHRKRKVFTEGSTSAQEPCHSLVRFVVEPAEGWGAWVLASVTQLHRWSTESCVSRCMVCLRCSQGGSLCTGLGGIDQWRTGSWELASISKWTGPREGLYWHKVPNWKRWSLQRPGKVLIWKDACTLIFVPCHSLHGIDTLSEGFGWGIWCHLPHAFTDRATSRGLIV